MNENLPLGAHLVTPRGWYSHHGIYVGNGRVVHYSGFCNAFHRGPVQEVSVAEFEYGHGFEIRLHSDARHSPAEIAARARGRLGENRYRLFANNCEHFCQWCVTGCARCEQIEQLLSLPVAIARRAAGAVYALASLVRLPSASL